MKTVSGISQANLTKFLQFYFEDDFHYCKLHKAKGEFHVLINNTVTKEIEDKWKNYWKDLGVPIKFLRYLPPSEDA